jgi:hypothetical protein
MYVDRERPGVLLPPVFLFQVKKDRKAVTVNRKHDIIKKRCTIIGRDPRKGKLNVESHKIAFEKALTVLHNP